VPLLRNSRASRAGCPTHNGQNISAASDREVVLHLRRVSGGNDRIVEEGAYTAPSKAPNSQACPCRLLRVIPSACPFRIMFAASIP
jgi:hypothetical protein